GAQTVTPPQHSPNDIPWWWIAITALGDFDADTGGHLILWEVGRIIRFPPGATILLPPVIPYSIARIQPGETWYSLTQYAAAPPGWSRWPAPIHLFSKLGTLSTLRT
ncbi:hypothetical protein B0H13DRAFT_1663180, partial [Mycena leptocephala]